MGPLGLLELLILVVFVLLIAAGGSIARRRGGGRTSGPSLVLRKFRVEENAADGVFIDIVGRSAGLTAWFLTAVGVDAETSLRVTAREVYFKSASLFGQTHTVVSLARVSSTDCGYSKPLGHLVLAATFILGGTTAGLSQRRGGEGLIAVGLVIGAIFLLAYWLSKKVAMSIETVGGRTLGLIFKRSVIENIAIDIPQALWAISILNNRVAAAQARSFGS